MCRLLVGGGIPQSIFLNDPGSSLTFSQTGRRFFLRRMMGPNVGGCFVANSRGHVDDNLLKDLLG